MRVIDKSKIKKALSVLLGLSIFLYLASEVYLYYPTSKTNFLLEGIIAGLYEISGEVQAYNLPYYMVNALPIIILVSFGALFFLNYGILSKKWLEFLSNTEKAVERLPAVKSRQVFPVILAIALLLRAWNFMGDLGLGRGFSDGYSSYAAYEIMQGKVPYQDFRYTHLPLLPYAIATAYSLLGTGLLQARIFNLSVNFLSILPVYFLTKRWFGKNKALLASFLWAIYPQVVTTARYVGHESLMTLLILLSVWIVSAKKSGWGLFLSGAALGSAVLVKEPAMLMAIPFLAYLGGTGKKALVWILGVLAVVTPVVGYFTLVGGSKFLEYNILFHAALPPQDSADKAYVFFSEIFRLDNTGGGALRGMMVLLFASIGFWKAASKINKQMFFMLLWFLSALLLLFNKGFWWHYPLQLMPPFLIFLSLGLSYAPKRIKGGKAYALFAAFFTVAMLLQEDMRIIQNKDDTQAVVAEALGSVTKRNDTVLTSMLAIPLIAERRVPGDLFEFGYQNALLSSEYAIGVAEKEKVSAIVMDWRVIDEERAKKLEGFREYTQTKYRKAWQLNSTYKDGDISIWVRKTTDR